MPAVKTKKPQQIISGLQPATRTQPIIALPRKPGKQNKIQIRLLLAAFALFGIAVVLSINATFFPAAAAKETPYTEPEDATAFPRESAALATPSAPAAARAEAPKAFVPHLGRLRPDNYLESLTIDGKAPEFLSVGDLHLPKDGRPLLAYVLLNSQLDQRTEQAWRRSGMFQDEGRTISPWLRLVTITDQETMDNLIDWHVDKVAPK